MAVQLPLYSHPITTVLVDDDRSSLAQLERRLDRSIARVAFQRARQALEFICEGLKRAARLQRPVEVLRLEGDSVIVTHTFESEMARIYRYVSTPQRFAMPVVVIIDYDMPDVDGIDFCRSVAHLPCGKILFTGLGDDRVAVDAFNQGLINRFVKKPDPDALDQLEAGIAELQYAYFLEQTRAQAERLERDTYSFLSDQAVSALLKDLCNRYGYVEYYLLTNPSGFMLFDMAARGTVLVIQTRASLHGQADVAHDMGADARAVEDLRACRVVPFFQTSDGMWHADMPGAPSDYCRPARICHGRENYFWALFEPPTPAQQPAPYSHLRYLEEGVSAA